MTAVLILWAAVLWPIATPVPNQSHELVLIDNISIVDVDQGEVIEGSSILIREGQIVTLGAKPTGSEFVVDGSGRYAIPGMFDMHTHSLKLSPVLFHPLYVASGVTAVRDMGGCIDGDDSWVACAQEKREWTRKVEEGTHIGPRYDQVTSLAINGGSEIPSGLAPALGAGTSEGARLRVVHDQKRGIDFLKTYNNIPRDAYFALANAVKQTNLYLAGHIPTSVTAIEAANAGQRSFEHGMVLILDCYPDIDEIRNADDFFQAYTDEARMRMVTEHDAARCSRIHNAMRRNQVALVPTHTTRKLDAYAANESYRSDSRLRYIPDLLRRMWLGDADSMAKRGSAESYQAIYELGIAQTGVAHRAGVTVLAGTDSPDSFAFPGLSLADELNHLVAAGLSPLDALRSATREPAKFLGLEGKAGVIRSGARADIVLLNSNPLSEIDAVRDVHTVVLAGVVYDREDLKELRSTVEKNASHLSLSPKLVWQLLRSPIMRRQFAD
ncbi:amidohydrolase family protein [Congregibacter sp.]|uniref:amidohydrolase family protein n=1 Tax=Congregibacter sp. TaxID=2744308 RepID=UPI0038591A36